MGFSIFLALIALVCLFLVIFIMVQNPKGGGLSSSFGGSQVVGGVQKTSDFLDKGTWFLATALVALIILSTLSMPGNNYAGDDKYIDEDAVVPTEQTAPAATEGGAEGTATPAAPATQETAPQQ